MKLRNFPARSLRFLQLGIAAILVSLAIQVFNVLTQWPDWFSLGAGIANIVVLTYLWIVLRGFRGLDP